MRKNRIERKIKVVSSGLDDFGRIKTGLSGLLAGLLICLTVGSFCVVTYGASGADVSATEDVVHEADASAAEDVVHERRMRVWRKVRLSVCLTGAKGYSVGIRHTRERAI